MRLRKSLIRTNLKLKLKIKSLTRKIGVADQQYIISTGVFKNAAGAEKFRLSTVKSGWTARVININMAKTRAYSVQVGPFNSKNQAMLVQHQLQMKSVNGIIRKL